MKVYSIYILNKAGGLIYQKDFNHGLNKLSANDYLVLAGTLHGVHAIASKLKPIIDGTQDDARTAPNQNVKLYTTGRAQNPNTNLSGLQSIETDLFNLYVFQTLTGVKFIIITSPNPVVHNLQPINETKFNRGELNKQLEATNIIFKQLYIHYSDYVMKDPFYSLEMPIKSPLFDTKVAELVS
ncbi:uncharacterized protein PRCAT00000076001 [Priceomyces carsonii]|uniref:uncharacterized protein n=1 Tax=Priceomyces carsonii TaxID=28549 RepID=UPI002EDBA257|nr:unnamed protein product [Priceomyces carsonii]